MNHIFSAKSALALLKSTCFFTFSSSRRLALRLFDVKLTPRIHRSKVLPVSAPVVSTPLSCRNCRFFSASTFCICEKKVKKLGNDLWWGTLTPKSFTFVARDEKFQQSLKLQNMLGINHASKKNTHQESSMH